MQGRVKRIIVNQSTPPAPLRIGDTAPNFTARSTRGPISLADFQGRWLVLFAHPADFTPVCTSEFVALAQAAARFDAMDCALLGVSVDSLYSHLAWLRLIRDRFGVEVNFPLVEDPTLEIARAYGMIGPDALDASAVRATYILDPAGVLRAMTCYPVEIGRSIDEILRMLAALQRVSRAAVFTPADWRPGAELLRAPTTALDGVMGGASASDWFYTTVADKD